MVPKSYSTCLNHIFFYIDVNLKSNDYSITKCYMPKCRVERGDNCDIYDIMNKFLLPLKNEQNVSYSSTLNIQNCISI